jgi:subtilisin family serine protease
MMNTKRVLIPIIALAVAFMAPARAAAAAPASPASATPAPTGVIVRTINILPVKLLCADLKICIVAQVLDGVENQLFLLQIPQLVNANLVVDLLRLVPGVIDVEVDQTLNLVVSGRTTSGAIPLALFQHQPTNFFGTQVNQGYVNQAALTLIQLPAVQKTLGHTGSGIIADIDTGVDPTHPVLKPVLLAGYDFTRNRVGGNELLDLNGKTGNSCTECQPANINQYTAAMVDQFTAAMVDGTAYSAFGHGTEVAGVLHLVAPSAKLMPLKAFGPDGTGSLSNVLAAIYYGVSNKANVINMSFDFTSSSAELKTAVAYAVSHSVICVASAGNAGADELVYPAAYQQYVIGVGSVSDNNTRSTFSNYGDSVVWLAAPGEAVVTTYPFDSYAAVWGTSFSSPLVAGTADLLPMLPLGTHQAQAQAALKRTTALPSQLQLGYGELNVPKALGLNGLLP